MRNLEFGVAVGSSIVLTLYIVVWLIRWAKRGGRGAALLGGLLFITLGGAMVPQPPHQRIEEAREDRGKKGGESGDPPNPTE
jgi:hypothetical protein